MIFRIPYRVYADQDGSYFYSVLLRVARALPGGRGAKTKRFEAVIDSGASRCIVHADFAERLGLKLKAGVPEATNGIGGETVTWLHDVLLYLPGGPVTVRAGFKADLPVAGLLGMDGFFEHFRVTFDADELECQLERLGQSME